MSKPQLLALSVKRALRNGFEADYLLGDAWFGNKPTLRLTEEFSLKAVLRMKKDKTTYRYTTFKDGKMHQTMLTAVEIVQKMGAKTME
jgi:SRSO17 transposase